MSQLEIYMWLTLPEMWLTLNIPRKYVLSTYTLRFSEMLNTIN